jgi:hypothetical protein
MGYRDFPTPLMIELSGDWIDPAGARAQIEELPAAAALLPKITETHRALLKTQAKPKKVPAELASVQEEQAELDTVHDRKARGLFTVLTGFADLTDDPDQGSAFLALRDKIFPPEVGLRVVQLPYAEEAGEAKLVEERLDEEDRALLKKLAGPDGKLLDAHKARIKAAARIGELEQKRHDLAGKEDAEETTKQADVLKARNGWIRVARALVAVIDLTSPTATVRKRILGRLEVADAKVSRRQKPAGGGAEPPTPADDSPAGPEE